MDDLKVVRFRQNILFFLLLVILAQTTCNTSKLFKVQDYLSYLEQKMAYSIGLISDKCR
jgi:hypothetical protein